jgi:hypothetical protein
MRSAGILVLLAPLLIASAASESPATNSERHSSARFFQVSAYPSDEAGKPVPTHAVVEGAFDWRDRAGWAVQRYANGSIFWRQGDGACVEWVDESLEGPGSSEPMKIEDTCGLPAMANDPRTTFARIRKTAAVKKIGTEELDGVSTTRLRATWRSEKRDPVDLWVDDANVVRRLRFGVRPFSLTIDYLDFGVDAAAEWESPNDPPRWTPDESAKEVSK